MALGHESNMLEFILHLSAYFHWFVNDFVSLVLAQVDQLGTKSTRAPYER